ncbi:MAG: DUF885 domain-containing protein [Deltaproteobacteria bacterium]|nr:DUF885 domain-containing protein [Deltaproteobacteria bacterium]
MSNTIASTPTISTLGSATRLIEDAWLLEMQNTQVAFSLGHKVDRLPDISLEAITENARRWREIGEKALAIGEDSLPHDMAVNLRNIRFNARHRSRQDDWYWLVFDPAGVGFYGLFAGTAYCGGFMFNSLAADLLARFRFDDAGDLDRYAGLLADTTRLIHQMAARTEGQAQRGIYMPKCQIDQARVLLERLKQAVMAAAAVSDERLGNLATPEFKARLAQLIQKDIGGAFDQFISLLGDDYRAQAPEAVGMAQYPGGAEIYAELVKLHTTQDLTPQQVHDAGLNRIQEIRSRMAAIRDEVGFDGDDLAYLAGIDEDPAWRADTADGVQAVFRGYIERIKPLYDQYFYEPPPDDYDAEALPAALEGSMTFGFFDAPGPGKLKGRYLFNAANLTKKGLCNIASLNYHELVPGHHLHLSTQKNNQAVHPIQNFAFPNAFNEGWAEYAGTLAGELGCYSKPEERFGRLVMDAFLSCRLVVDTGMNTFGWTLEKARDYMRENAFMSEAEVFSESVRYSCDIPAQSLAYKLGDIQMLRLREKMQVALGEKFDIRDFHQAVLHPGGMPLPDLEWHIDWTIDQLRKS